MCFKTSSVKRFGDVKCQMYIVSYIVSYFRHVFTEGTATGGGSVNPPLAVARMQAWIRLRHWSVPSPITLCSTPNHASIRFCLKSSTSWAFSGRLSAPYFEINVLRWGLFTGQKSGSSYKSYIIALLDWEQRMMDEMSGQTQLAERISTRIY